MSGPPANIDASELWLSLSAVPRAFRTFDWPSKDPVIGSLMLKVDMVPLTQEETNTCARVAEKTTKEALAAMKIGVTEGELNRAYHSTWVTESAVQTLSRAMKDVKDDKHTRPAVPSTQAIRSLTPDTLAVLMNYYLRTCSECGPILSNMTEAEMDAWLARIGEGAAAFPFDALSSEQKDELLRRSAFLLRKLPTVIASSGSKPESGGLPSVDDAPDAEPVDEMPAATVDPVTE